MRTLALAALLLIGCNDTVRVLDTDGTKSVAYCDDYWVKCIHDACPDGFDVVVAPGIVAGIVRCKAAAQAPKE